MDDTYKVETYDIHEVPNQVKNGVTYYTCSGKSVGCMLKSARKSDGTIWYGAAHYCSSKKLQPHRYAVNFDIEGKIVSIGIIGRCTHTSLDQDGIYEEKAPRDIESTLMLYLTSSPKFTQLGHYRQTKHIRKAMEFAFSGLFIPALSLISRDKKIVFEWAGYPPLDQTVDAILELLEISWLHGFYSNDEKAVIESIAHHIKLKRRLPSATPYQVEKFLDRYVNPSAVNRFLNKIR
jgi:hypothetical protein